MRWIDIYENDQLDEAQMATLFSRDDYFEISMIFLTTCRSPFRSVIVTATDRLLELDEKIMALLRFTFRRVVALAAFAAG